MIIALVFTLVVLLYRLLPMTGVEHEWLSNFSPLGAVALCGAVFLPKRAALILPAGLLLLSDLILNSYYGVALVSVEMAVRYAAIAVVIGLGFALRSNPNFPRLIGASLFGSCFFYLVTNTMSWMSQPAYAKNLAGWMQALTVGEPGFAPTYLFFRNSVVSDLLFTVLFVACVSVRGRRAAARPAVTEGAIAV